MVGGLEPVRKLTEPASHDLSRNPPRVVSSADEAVSYIETGSSVFVHSAAATPTGLTLAMCNRAVEKDLKDIKVMHMHTEGPAPYLQDPEVSKRFRTLNFFLGGNARAAVNDPKSTAEFVPIFLSEVSAVHFARVSTGK
jgi:acyl-CoA hydrolase